MDNDQYSEISDSSQRKSLLRKLSRCTTLTMDESFLLNNLTIQESQLIWNKNGNAHFVISDTNHNQTLLPRKCYYNAVVMMKDNYDYVEGYIIIKGTEYKIAHAWNVDTQGNHIDFTIPDAEIFDYFGVMVEKPMPLTTCSQS